MSKEWRSSDKDREVREEKIHPWKCTRGTLATGMKRIREIVNDKVVS
jgi:hypothetical protein